MLHRGTNICCRWELAQQDSGNNSRQWCALVDGGRKKLMLSSLPNKSKQILHTVVKVDAVLRPNHKKRQTKKTHTCTQNHKHHATRRYSTIREVLCAAKTSAKGYWPVAFLRNPRLDGTPTTKMSRNMIEITTKKHIEEEKHVKKLTMNAFCSEGILVSNGNETRQKQENKRRTLI